MFNFLFVEEEILECLTTDMQISVCVFSKMKNCIVDSGSQTLY